MDSNAESESPKAQLEKLTKLHTDGFLTDDEFNKLVAALNLQKKPADSQNEIDNPNSPKLETKESEVT